MFAGIVQATTTVQETKLSGVCLSVRLRKPAGWRLVLGQSIAVDGICSTVCSLGRGFFAVEYMPETLKKTTAGAFAAGREVNLERSLTLGSFVDAGLVLGHVDACGKVTTAVAEGETKRIGVSLPAGLREYVVPCGSIVVNGVSLTVVDTLVGGFSVALIPYTLTHTNLDALRPGDRVNIEIDLFARYAVRTLLRSGKR